MYVWLGNIFNLLFVIFVEKRCPSWHGVNEVCITKKMIELTEAEQKLIEQIRNLEWGRIETVIKGGQVVMISVKKDIKIDINLTGSSVSAIIQK